MGAAGTPYTAGSATSAGSFPTTIRSSGTIAGLLALLPVAATIHYANEYADRDTDAITDRTPFSGGSGALVETGLPASFLRTATAAAAFASIGVLAIGFVGGWLPLEAVGLLVLGFVAGLAYSLPPIQLVRRGAGEPINALLGGVFLPIYGVAVVGTPAAAAWLVVVPFALVVGCNLLAVHWPDREADAAVGKRTLAVRLSPGALRRSFALLSVTAGAIAAVLWSIGVLPDLVAMAHLTAAPFLLWGWITLTRRRSPLPAVAAMVVLAASTTIAWWWVAVG